MRSQFLVVEMNIMSFNPFIGKVIDALEIGDTKNINTYSVHMTKNEQGYWDWDSITPVEE